MASTKSASSPREPGDVISIVKALFDDPEMQDIHNRIRGRLRPLHSMDLDEDLPEHFTRGDFMALRVPTLIKLSDDILADTTGFPSTTQVNIIAPPYDDSATKLGDSIEQWGAMFRSKNDEGRRVTRDNRWHLLLSSYSVMMLRCLDPDSPRRWEVEIPEPTTCAFPLRSAPFRPRRFARHYRMLVSEIVDTYKGTRDWQPGKQLVMSATGNWDWEQLNDEQDVIGTPMHAPASSYAQEVEVYELDDGDWIETVAGGLGEARDTGEMVSRVKNLTGGCRAVVMSAGANPRKDKHRYQPMLWPVYQLILNLNELRAMRATRSVNVKPDVLVEQTPEQAAAAQAAGSLANNSIQMEGGGPSLVNINGKPTPWVMDADPDLDKSIEDIRNELAQVVASYSQTANEKVIQEANVNVFLPYAENVRNKQAPMLQQDDWGWAWMTRMALASIAEYDEAVPLYSMGTEVYGDFHKMEHGTVVTLDPADIDLDHFSVNVITQSITEAERRALIQDYAYRKSIGVSVHEEVLIAAGYSDTAKQTYRLAKDAGLSLGYTWNDQQLAAVIAEELRLTAGVLIPNYGAAPQAAAAAPPPGGGLTVNPPPIQGATGGSGVPGTNGAHP